MKKELLICTVFTALLGVAQADPAEDLANAGKKLAAAKNYTWASSSKWGDREARVTTGKTGSGGHTHLTIPMGDNSLEVLVRNGHVAFKGEAGWQLASAEAEGEENRRLRFLGRMAANYESPAKRVEEVIAGIQELKAEEGAYRGRLSEETAKNLMSWRGRGGGGEAPAIAGAAGSVVLHVADGMVTKYELTLSGKMTFNDQERDISRTTTIEFSEVGSTSFDIPEEAAGLLAQAPVSTS